MIRYTTKYIYIISIIVSLIIFLCINQLIENFSSNNLNFKADFITSQENILYSQNNISNNIQNISNKTIIKQSNSQMLIPNIEDENIIWTIEIPSISLNATIAEGTTKEIMDKYVGHFTETSKDIGNVGLAAHNRGYENNYFANIKKLKEGDEIIYTYKNFKKIYIVKKHDIISDTDWSYLEKGEKNKITLITCVENEPQYRRCIQAIEK